MNPYKIIDINRTDSLDAVMPVSLADAKKWLKVTFTDDDDVITDLIESCTRAVEEFCCISLVNSEVAIIVELNPPNNRSCIEFPLPYGPVVGVPDFESSIVVRRLTETIGGTYELMTAGTDYDFDGITHARFYAVNSGRYRITYNATILNIPERLNAAVKSEIAYRYENRGDAGDSNNRILSPQALSKAQPYKRFLWL